MVRLCGCGPTVIFDFFSVKAVDLGLYSTIILYVGDYQR